MAVDVEISHRAVKPLADQVGQVAKRKNVGGAVERYAVLERKPLARFNFAANWKQTRIVDHDLHVIHTPGLRSNISAAQNRKNSTLT